MSETISTALVEGARVFARSQTERARYDYLTSVQASKNVEAEKPKTTVHNEEIVPNVELTNTLKRVEVEGGTHVLVVDHKEYLEKKRQPPVPPTAEELEQRRLREEQDQEHKQLVAKLWAGVVSLGMLVTGVVVVLERRNKPTYEPTYEPQLTTE